MQGGMMGGNPGGMGGNPGGMGGNPGGGGGGGRATLWHLGMPNNRVLVLTTLPAAKLEPMIQSANPSAQLTGAIADLAKEVQDAPFWYAQALNQSERDRLIKQLGGLAFVMPSLKDLISSETAQQRPNQPPLKNKVQDGGPFKQIKGIQAKVSFAGSDMDITASLVFMDDASASKAAEGVKKVLAAKTEIKGLVGLAGMRMKKEDAAKLQTAVDEVLPKIKVQPNGKACEIGGRMTKAQVDLLKNMGG
jgi:hypothetical protein